MIEVMQQVISVLVSDVLAPAVARTGDLDGVVQHIKYSVAHYAKESGLTPDILAMHFGKSERSIYRYFEQMEVEPKKGEKPKLGEMRDIKALDLSKPPKKGVPAHDGVALMSRILEFFYSHKEPRDADACVRFVRRGNPHVAAKDVMGLLDLYALMGHLRKITEQEGGTRKVRYQAPEQGVLHDSLASDEERLQLLSRKLRALLPLVLAYLRRDEGSSMVLLQGRIMRSHLVAAMRDIHDFTIKRFNQAREDTERDDPDGREDAILACTLVLGGPATLDDLEMERALANQAASRAARGAA